MDPTIVNWFTEKPFDDCFFFYFMEFFIENKSSCCIHKSFFLSFISFFENNEALLQLGNIIYVDNAGRRIHGSGFATTI